MTLTDKAVKKLSPVVVASAFIVEPFLFCGAFIWIHTGKAPEGWWWSYIPGIFTGLTSILSQALVLFITVTYEANVKIKRLLYFMWSTVFFSFCVIMPLYFLGSQRGINLSEVLEWVGVSEDKIGIATLLVLLCIADIIQVSPSALLIAIRLTEGKKTIVEGGTAEVVTPPPVPLKGDKGTVIKAIAEYGGRGMVYNEMSDETGLSSSMCYDAVMELDSKGLLIKNQQGRFTVTKDEGLRLKYGIPIEKVV